MNETLLKWVREIGFPVVVAVYLLWNIGAKLDTLNASAQETNILLRAHVGQMVPSARR